MATTSGNNLPSSQQPTLPLGRARMAMIVVLFASNILASFTQSIMDIALDQVATEFSVSLSVANWVVLGYAIVTGTVITTAASLLARFGIRRVMTAGYIAALVGSLLGFFATSFPVMVAARLIQAITTGLFFPIINEALLTLSPKGKGGFLLSVNSGVIGLGLACAPPVAGVILTCAGVKYIFLIPAVLAAVLLIAGKTCMHDLYPRQHRPIDALSILLSFAGLACFMEGLNSVSHKWLPATGLMIAGAVAVALFIFRQNRLEHPLLDLRPFKTRAFSLGEILIMLGYMASMFFSLLVPLYLEGALGYSPFLAGCLLTAPIICYASVCFLSGRILGKYGVWPLIPAGFALLIVSAAGLAFSADQRAVVPFIISVVIGFAGIGVYYPAVKSVDLEVLPQQLSSNGSSIHSTLVQIAGSISSALFVGIMSSNVARLMAAGAAKSSAYVEGFNSALYIEGALLVVAFVISLIYVRVVNKISK